MSPSNTILSDTKYGIRHLFTGQQYYNELDLYDLRNRYYSPDIGRFLQADPARFGGDATNLYRYCGNNPLTRSDPTGLYGPDDPDAPTHPPDPTWELPQQTIFGSDPMHLPQWDANSFPAGDPSLTLANFGTGPGSVGGGPFHFHIHSGVTTPGPTISVPPLAPAEPPRKPGLTDKIGGWLNDMTMFADWALGIGPQTLSLDQNSIEASMMQDAAGVQQAVTNFWWNNTGQDWSQASAVTSQVPFGAGGYKAAAFNPTQQFVGGYTVYVNPSGPNAVQVSLWNQTSLQSAIADWKTIPYYSRSTFPLGGNMYQTITFRLPYP